MGHSLPFYLVYTLYSILFALVFLAVAWILAFRFILLKNRLVRQILGMAPLETVTR